MKIRGIYISSGHDFLGRSELGRLNHETQKVDSVLCIASSGLLGDRYFNHKKNYNGQVTFFDWEVYIKIKVNFHCSKLDPSSFRRNIITEGTNLNKLIGKRFSIQGLNFEGTEECRPCAWMDKAICNGVYKALKGSGGLRARILSSGTLRVDH